MGLLFVIQVGGHIVVSLWFVTSIIGHNGFILWFVSIITDHSRRSGLGFRVSLSILI